MEPIVAVRIRDGKAGRLIQAFTARTKNRKLAWAVLIQDKSMGAALVEVERWEEQRRLVSKV